MASQEFRSMTEFTLPAMVPGVFAGVVGSLLAGASGLTMFWAVAAGVALGGLLAIAGAVHGALVVTGKIPSATFVVSALFWLVAFPVALLAYAVVTEWGVTGRPGLPADVVGFLTFKAILSTGFAFGFAWVQEQVGLVWWPRIRAHNRYAAMMVEMYKSNAVALQRRKRPRNNGRKGSGRGDRRTVVADG